MVNLCGPVETGALVNGTNRAGKSDAVHDILDTASQTKRPMSDPIVEEASRVKSEEASGEGKVNDRTPEVHKGGSVSLLLMKTHEICMTRFDEGEEKRRYENRRMFSSIYITSLGGELFAQLWLETHPRDLHVTPQSPSMGRRGLDTSLPPKHPVKTGSDLGWSLSGQVWNIYGQV